MLVKQPFSVDKLVDIVDYFYWYKKQNTSICGNPPEYDYYFT